jgi:hypothetical protein
MPKGNPRGYLKAKKLPKKVKSKKKKPTSVRKMKGY